MGFWSKWFPSKEERLEQARQALRDGRYEEVRSLVARVDGDEADGLYDAASEKMGVVAPAPEPPSLVMTRRFVCWELQVTTTDPNLRRGFLKLVVNELASAGINLDKREVNLEALEQAVTRAQRSFRADHPDDPRYLGLVKVTPL